MNQPQLRESYVLNTLEQTLQREQFIAPRELRFVITQDCNYDCFFCHKEGFNGNEAALLAPGDYAFLFGAAKEYLGTKTLTISGGEPLKRRDCVDIVSALYDEGARMTIVTNGYYLDRRSAVGDYVERLNVSIHSLDKERFEKTVRTPGTYDRVISNLRSFKRNYPEVDIRINTTYANGINDHDKDISQFMDFAKQIGASIKYMEIYPKGSETYLPLATLSERLLDRGFVLKENSARKQLYSLDGLDIHLTKIFCSLAAESLDPSSYCMNNNDLFISPDGVIKPCRASGLTFSILDDVKGRDYRALTKKLDAALGALGKGCCLGR